MDKTKRGLLKWAGGKEREISALKSIFPQEIDKYFEPFIGGGSVYLNVEASCYFINDFYDELIEFYRLALSSDQELKENLLSLDNIWHETTNIFLTFSQPLTECVRNSSFAYMDKIIASISEVFLALIAQNRYRILLHEKINFRDNFEKVVKGKIQRICAHEKSKGELSDLDLQDNLKTALKSAIYTHIRNLYNLYRSAGDIHNPFFIACFFFIRNYCYSSMFRYNSNNEFNVPYGGISYNENYMERKIEYIYSNFNQVKFKKTSVDNLDFQQFLEKYQYSENDFIFLDPPYDSEFSDYAGNIFSKEDQKRLAYFLQNTNAKFLLVIKRTDFIERLYTNDKFNIRVFEKNYQVSFKNRNNRKVEHLVITNF